MTGILLSLLLLILGAPPIENADEVTVVFAPLENPDHAGVACLSDFREIPGNAQGYCDGYEDGAVIVDAAKLWRWSDGRPATYRFMLLEVLAHEAKHIELGPDPSAADPFMEADCYRAGREYATEVWNQRTSAVRAALMGRN